MPDKEDHLSNELTISAKLEENGVTAAAKSRFLSSLDRLLGAAFDIPTAWLEGKAESIRVCKALPHTDETRALPVLIDEHPMPVYDEEIGETIRVRESRKILNKKEVLDHAADDLVATPDAEQSDEESLDKDWLNYFEEYAEKASTAEVQKLWGRVLAGEIRKPKTFSLRTLRFLSELDADTARIFEKTAKKRLSDIAIFRLEKSSGQELLETMELEEVGLLQDVVNGITQTYEIDEEGKCLFSYGGYLLQLKPKNGKSFKLRMVKISKVGKEIITLLEAPPALENFKVLFDHLIEKEEMTWGLIGQITSSDGDLVRFNILRRWEQPKA